MSKTSGLADGFIVGGYDLSGTVNSIDQISGGPALLDVTSIEKSGARADRRPPGRDHGVHSFADITGMTPGFSDSLHTLPTVDTIGMYLRGSAIGQRRRRASTRSRSATTRRGARTGH